jgi:hypothetical protein
MMAAGRAGGVSRVAVAVGPPELTSGRIGGNMNVICRLGAVTAAMFVVVPAPSAVGAGAVQIGGVGAFDTSCPAPPGEYADFVDYPPIRLTGSLDGCWYTKVENVKDNGIPSGVYLETGREVFVGSVSNGPSGSFETTYRFESKWQPDVSTGVEVHGRCQHPIVAGTGTGGFAGVTGRVDFKDIVADGTYVYRGHLRNL